LVGDSDVGKQEIITGMEDGSMDSVYCTSTGAGIYMYSTMITRLKDGSMDSVCVSKIIPNNLKCFIVLEGNIPSTFIFGGF